MADHVILLHGLARSAGSMRPLERALETAGYSVDNVDYNSRSAPIEDLAAEVVGAALRRAFERGAGRIHFVTHSMGGILVRWYFDSHRVANLGRVVMLGPPNHGSEVVDRLRGWSLFNWINGPAGRQLGTDENSVPANLGPATVPVGVIAGDRSINWINSMILPGANDGKVTVESSRLEGGADHIVIHATHPLIMRHREAIRQTLHFLQHGRFDHPDVTS